MDVLSEFGKKLADRWLTVLLLPGLLFTATSGAAVALGHAQALNLLRLAGRLQRFGAALIPQPANVVVATATALLVATAAGLCARALGTGVHRALVSRRPRWWVKHRHRRAVTGGSRTVPASYLPARVSPAGDRFRLIGERVEAQYGLAVSLAWPRLWLLLSEDARKPITAGYGGYRDATTLIGWGMLYLAVGVQWWPAVVAGGLTIVVGYRRALATAATVSDLIEATVDVHQAQLATAVGIVLPHGRLTPNEGVQINNILNKRA
ncbi:hypothetical protein [Saccharothrix stipae]